MRPRPGSTVKDSGAGWGQLGLGGKKRGRDPGVLSGRFLRCFCPPACLLHCLEAGRQVGEF